MARHSTLSFDRQFVKHVLDAARRVAGEGESREQDLTVVFGHGSDPGSGSRQARHARTQRAMVTAAAALTVLGMEEDDCAWVFGSPDFARLRGNSADVHVRIGEFLGSRADRLGGRLERVWAHQSQALLQHCTDGAALDRTGLLVMQGLLAPLFACAVMAGPALGAAWRTLWAGIEVHASSNPSLYLHVAMIGAFAGEPRILAEALLQERMQPYALCAGLCLVRHERTDDVLDVVAEMMSGRPLDPRRCLSSIRPVSTLWRLSEYVRSCMRNPRHFYNDGLALNVLQWHHDACSLASSLVESHERARLQTELGRFEQVQLLEKKRFWDVHDAAATEMVQRKLSALWMAPRPADAAVTA
jgi:hypothetical protein